jgi:prefoldin subunit 5
MTKEMGGVITRKEMDEVEAHYRENLQALQKQIPQIESKINSLKELKDQFSELSTPTTGKKPAPM